MNFGCDRIVCISLENRLDKRERISHIMKDNNIDFKFFSAIRDENLPSRGCFKSHFKVISDAANDNVKRLMIFEDDIGYPNIDIEKITIIQKFLDKKEWSIFFLGGCANIWNRTVKPVLNYKNIYKGNFYCTHSYILNSKSIEYFKNIEWGKPHKLIDAEVFHPNKKSYIFLPEIYKQSPIQNDIGKNSPIFLKFRLLGVDICNLYAQNINIKVNNILIIVILIAIIYSVNFLNKRKPNIKYSRNNI